MKKILGLLLLAVLAFGGCRKSDETSSGYADLKVDPRTTKIEMYWKSGDEPFKSLGRLKQYVEASSKKLRFAMNAGIYDKSNTPLGLYIERGELKVPLNTKKGEGNFYLEPNGVFYLTKDGPGFIVKTSEFVFSDEISYATQSGPLLLVDGQINGAFTQGSNNLNIRNGVCVFDNKDVVFSISRRAVSLYDFAKHFQDLGCRSALYLDGYVSRMYLPEQNMEQVDGDFAAMIAIAE